MLCTCPSLSTALCRTCPLLASGQVLRHGASPICPSRRRAEPVRRAPSAVASTLTSTRRSLPPSERNPNKVASSANVLPEPTSPCASSRRRRCTTRGSTHSPASPSTKLQPSSPTSSIALASLPSYSLTRTLFSESSFVRNRHVPFSCLSLRPLTYPVSQSWLNSSAKAPPDARLPLASPSNSFGLFGISTVDASERRSHLSVYLSERGWNPSWIAWRKEEGRPVCRL